MRLSFDQYRRGFLDGTKRGDDSNAGVGKRTKRRQDHSLKLREGRAVEDQRVIDDVDAAIADLAKLASDVSRKHSSKRPLAAEAPCRSPA
jgi:hypothetical protein